MSLIAAHLQQIHSQIKKEAEFWGRPPKDITLIAVSKQQPESAILAALQAGQRVFGENRVQEAEEKWLTLKTTYPDIELHFIGHLQTNKAKQAVALFDVIETVDRSALAEALLKEMQKQQKWPRCFIEINTGEEPQKSGVLPQEADGFIEACRKLGLPIIGIMGIPPAHEPSGPHFGLLKTIADKHLLPCVSMGMSHDFMLAIRLGATHVRVGTAIFGERGRG